MITTVICILFCCMLLCRLSGSSSSSTTTQSSTDPEAARRMAAVAERQQEMAEQQWALGREVYEPYEREMVEANRRLLQESEGVPAKYMAEVMRDYDPRQRMGEASADVEQAFASSEGATRREFGRMGISPTSGRYASIGNRMQGEKTKALAGARTMARRSAATDTYNKLAGAMGMRSGGQIGNYQMTNPLDRSSKLYGGVMGAHEAGMRPLTSSRGGSSGWSAIWSSIRYKENIEPLEAINIDDIEAVTFNYKKGMNMPDGKTHIGFIAEDLREIVPEAVICNDRGFAEGIEYAEMIPVLLNEIKRLRKRVEKLEVK